ncbi:MAG TPA: ROK family transcriptional regulator [Clostridiaceae bacterium]|nr:ROK family transcriptional regulator [Clostridiaceae bacterium]
MNIENEIGNVQLMQKINRLKVLNFIRQKGEVARPEIAKNTGLSPSSITNIVSYLLEKKLVMEVGRVDSKEVGRKATLIRFNPSAATIISVNIETSKVDAALTDLEGNILHKKEIAVGHAIKSFEILNILKKEINSLINEAEARNLPHIAGIGIAVSGLVLDDKKLVISSSLKWREFSLKEYFEDLLHIPVYLQNNSRTKALAVLKKKQGEFEKNIVFLDLTMGIGIINFYDQKINEAVIGEFGHTSVKKDGPLCFCGNRGCIEVMCSVETILNQCSELLDQGKCKILKNILEDEGLPLSYETIIKAFDEGDGDVRDVLKECGEYLGVGIANIINIFNPQRIIINGDILLTCGFIFETAVKEAGSRAYEQFTKDLKYEKVNIDSEQAIRGVSLFVAEKLFDLAGPEW